MQYDLLATVIGSLLGFVFSESKHKENFDNGYKFLNRACEGGGDEDLNDAIREFRMIDEDDLLYLNVAAQYCLAVCYAKKNEFGKSYQSLDYIKNVQYDFFTRKKDTIEEIRSRSFELRRAVEEAEKAYLEELRKKTESDQRQNSMDKIWKIVAIAALAVAAAAIIGVIALAVM